MRDLVSAIEDHRAMYRADLLIPRLVSRQPPTSLDLNTGVLDQEPGAATGMAMSGRLLRFLSHPEGYGQDFPWHRALWQLRVECRREHPQHRSSEHRYWRGALCWQIVSLTVTREWTPEQAAQILRLESPEPVLSQGLRFIQERMDDFRKAAEKRAREDEGQALVCVCGHSQSRHPRTVEWSCLDFNGVRPCGCKRYRADNQIEPSAPASDDEGEPDWLVERKRYFGRARAMGVKIHDPLRSKDVA